MAFDVVLDGPPHSRARRMASAAARAAGTALLMVTTVACVPAFLIGILEVLQVLPSDRERPLDDVSAEGRRILLAGWLISVAVVVVAGGVGLRLARGHRRLVMFLRRFRNHDAARTVTAAASRLGGSWRLVTLDDTVIEPLGVDPRAAARAGKILRVAGAVGAGGGKLIDRAASVLKAVASALGVGAGLSGAVVFLSADGDAAQRLQATIGAVTFDGGRGAAETVLAFCMLGLGACLVAGLAFAIVVVLLLSAVPIATVLHLIERGIRHGEQDRAIPVDVADEIEPTRRRVRAITRKVFGPRLVVLTVNGDIWQPTVLGFSADSAIALIDVSEPSENVLWEIEQLTGTAVGRCVFVGEYGCLSRLRDNPPGDGTVDRLRELLDGHRVLAYTTDANGTERFVNALRGTFERAAHPRS
jgi:hypothetical protein